MVTFIVKSDSAGDDWKSAGIHLVLGKFTLLH